MEQQLAYAFLFTLLAGLSTGIGGLIMVFSKKPSKTGLSISLGASAGVMIYVSFMDLLPLGIESVGEVLGILLLFVGMALTMIIDWIIPKVENPHHNMGECLIESNVDKKNGDEESLSSSHKQTSHPQMLKTGTLTAITLAIHNFPEGLAAFGSTLADIQLGIVISIAVAIHNIPEGIAVACPIYFATGDKKKAFKISFLSGLTEPLGALIGYAFLAPFLTDQLIGGMMSVISGIMIYISLDELIPAAHSYGRGDQVVLGIVLGMAIMAVSLLLL
ncbi:Zinc transporter ZupT [Candidatus Lokiarchaeum ossiferum]|uniref:Zinc transporter ZupT n=1 Tax=Candidatus Lokiarchaeum ossiferum TaxID=2951803 RepID=A0ABY6HVL3_9ARCH|nr:Zinc transporter ZupT [Candidatus Lokiarchaeum sp. B-35]